MPAQKTTTPGHRAYQYIAARMYQTGNAYIITTPSETRAAGFAGMFRDTVETTNALETSAAKYPKRIAQARYSASATPAEIRADIAAHWAIKPEAVQITSTAVFDAKEQARRARHYAEYCAEHAAQVGTHAPKSAQATHALAAQGQLATATAEAAAAETYATDTEEAFQRLSAPATVAVFRVWLDSPETRAAAKEGKPQVLALFPYDPGTYDPATCGSYEHIGQHDSARPSAELNAVTRPAKPAEYAALARELESAPYRYRLEIRQRIPADAYQRRAAEIKAQDARAAQLASSAA